MSSFGPNNNNNNGGKKKTYSFELNTDNNEFYDRIIDTEQQMQELQIEQQRNNQQKIEKKVQYIEYPYIPNYQYRNLDRIIFKNQLNIDEDNTNASKIQSDFDKRMLYIKDYEYNTATPQKPVNQKKYNEEKKPQHETYEYILLIVCAPIGLIVYIIKEKEIGKYNEQKKADLKQALKNANVVKKIVIPKEKINNQSQIQNLYKGIMTTKINNPNDPNELKRVINNALIQNQRKQINNQNQNLTHQTSNNINNNQI